MATLDDALTKMNALAAFIRDGQQELQQARARLRANEDEAAAIARAPDSNGLGRLAELTAERTALSELLRQVSAAVEEHRQRLGSLDVGYGEGRHKTRRIDQAIAALERRLTPGGYHDQGLAALTAEHARALALADGQRTLDQNALEKLRAERAKLTDLPPAEVEVDQSPAQMLAGEFVQRTVWND